MSNEINIEELERLAKELIGSVPGTALYRDLSIVFTVTMSPDGVLSLIDRLKKAESDRDDLADRLEMDPDHGIPDGIDCRNATIEMQDAQISAMAAKLAELEGQYPVFAFRRRGLPDFCTCTEGRYAELAEKPHLFEVRKLYARPVPAEMSPDFTDTARAALLWVLWHHQGGSSPVGQPIRYALGMDAHEHLSKHQVQEAKRWAALTKSESNDFRQARTAPPEPVNVDFGKRGENMFFNIGNQSFLLDYKPEEQDEFDFMKTMLLSAFSRITHGVKTESQPVNSRLLDVATGKIQHRYLGLSPDSTNGLDLRDPDCPACQAIAAAEAQQERLLQDMHDAGREIDRVMAEAAPKVPQIDLNAIARAIWNVRREEEDRCDMELEDMRRDHSVWEEATEVASILKDAGIEVAE